MTLNNSYPLAGKVSTTMTVVIPLEDARFMQTYAPRNKTVTAFGRDWMVTGDGTVYATTMIKPGRYPVFHRAVSED